MSREKKFEYVSGEYISNCVIEAIKVKLKDPFHTKLYFCKPRIKDHCLQMFHFMWSDGLYDYDFSDIEDMSGYPLFTKFPYLTYIIFPGRIRRFKHGFAKKYTDMRNHWKGERK